MRKLFLLPVLLLLVSCQSKKHPSVPVFQGYWADSSGMAVFEVQNQEGKYQIRNAMGVLEGDLQDTAITGKTEQGLPFSLTVQGDVATYQIMDLGMQYHRIDKPHYDSLLTLQKF